MTARPEPPPRECKLLAAAIDDCEVRVRECSDEINRIYDQRQELRGHLQCLLMGWPTVAHEHVTRVLS